MLSVPRLADFETVLKIYYENTEIGQQKIKELFVPDKGKCISSATVRRLFLAAEAEEVKRGTMKWSSHRVNTRIAFEVWGIDIEDVERRKKKLDKLFMKGA